jgi:F0F1-type ATP synthase alpha subunit
LEIPPSSLALREIFNEEGQDELISFEDFKDFAKAINDDL